jgi:phage-related protein
MVNSGYLDVDHTELETDLSVLKGASDASWITLTLGGPNYLVQTFPQLTYIADHCNWLTVGGFKGAECAYSGVATTCDGLLTTCRTLNNSRRYGAHQGLTKTNFRLV